MLLALNDAPDPAHATFTANTIEVPTAPAATKEDLTVTTPGETSRMPNPLYALIVLRGWLLICAYSAAIYNSNPAPLMPPAISAPVTTTKAKGKAAKVTEEEPWPPVYRPGLAQRYVV